MAITTTDSLGRALPSGADTGDGWWEFDEISGFPDEEEGDCDGHFRHWWCTRGAGHEMPHRAGLSDVGVAIAEWWF